MDIVQPKLRFPAFRDNWNKKKLIDVNVSVIDGDRGSNYPNGNDFSKDGYCLFLNAKNVTKNGFSFKETTFISKEKDAKLRKGKLNRKDIILTTRGSVGHISYYDNNIEYDNIRINSGMVIIRTDFKFITSDYLYKYLNSNQIQNEINIVAFGSAQPQLTVNEILKFKICYPSLEEQTIIANFLSAIDEKINLLQEKKKLLQDYKKGIMQKIFNQEIRFKDDNSNDFEDWDITKLGKFAKITTGSSNREDSNLDGEYTFFDRSQDIRSSNRFLFDAEAIIVPGEGQVFIPKYFKGKFDLHQRTYAIMDFGKNNGVFLYYSITYNKSHLNSHAVGSTVKSLRLPMFESMPINLPSIKEQTKIANFLSAIDEKIELVSNQVQDTQEYKKGLLQQMFV